MNLDRAHIVYSPLTETFYLATGQRKGDAFIAATKVDRTHEFLAALIDWCGPGFERDIATTGGKIITVSMKEKEAA